MSALAAKVSGGSGHAVAGRERVTQEAGRIPTMEYTKQLEARGRPSLEISNVNRKRFLSGEHQRKNTALATEQRNGATLTVSATFFLAFVAAARVDVQGRREERSKGDFFDE